MMNTVLLIERDPELANRMIKWLTLERFFVQNVSDGHEALALLREMKYDFVILDSTIPESPKKEICNHWKANGGHTPILLLITGQVGESSEGNGADAYLEKPFHPRVLSSRLRELAGQGPEGGSTDWDHGPSGTRVPRKPILPVDKNQAALKLPDQESTS